MAIGAVQLHLLDRVHGFDAGDDLGRRAEGLEAEHGPGSALDRPVILLEHVVEVFQLTQLDGQAAVGDQALHRGSVRTALVDGDHPRHVVQVDGLLEESAGRGQVAPSGEQEIHGPAELVDRPVQVLPLPAHANVGLVHAPRAAHRLLAPSKHLGQHREHRSIFKAQR